MIFSKKHLLTFFILLISISGIAQDNNKQSLKKILHTLEQRYKILFTYIDENIAGIFITPPSKKIALEDALHHLRQQTALLFQQLNERYVAISKLQVSSFEVCGFVRFDDTGEKVAGATIQTANQISVSDTMGYFHLEKVYENNIIEIRYIGYETAQVPVTEFLSSPCKTITLRPRFTSLQEVFVSDFITTGIDKKVDGSFVIRPENLGMLPGLVEPDVMQTIQTLPGIQSVNETISDINVRGGTNDQNLILWDGIRMYHSGHFFGLISAYNPYLTEKITLVKNGSGAALGEGVSSTIDIRTNDQVTETFSAGAGINMINGDVFAKIPVSEKVSLQLSARRSVADLLQTPAYNQYFDRAFRNTDVRNTSSADTLVGRSEKFYFYDTSFKLLYNITNKDKLRFSFLNVFNNIEYQETALVDNVIESRTSKLEQGNLGSGISYSRLWNEKIRTSAQFYLSSYNLSAVNFDVLNDQRLIQENKVLDKGLKIDTRINLTEKINLFTGYQLSEAGVTNLEDLNNPPFQRSVKKVVLNHAYFLEGNFTFDKTNIVAGIRNTYFPNFAKAIIEPRFSFNQNFLKNFSFEILGEMKNQSITQIIDLQSDFLGVEKRRWVLSNDADIPVIRSRQVSAGVFYKKNNLLISMEGYLKLVKGIITSSQGFQDQFQFIRSTGDYKSIGIDFLVNKKFEQLTTWLSYSNADSKFEFPQLIPPSFPNNLDIPHRATVGCSYQLNNLELSAGMNWRSGRPVTGPVKTNEVVDNKINYDLPNSSRLDNYLRVDLSIRYRFPVINKVRAQVSFSVWNILNKENIVNTYYRIGDNNQLESIRQSSLGITPNLVFRVAF